MKEKINSFYKCVKYCLCLAWKASPIYTLVRLLSGMVASLLIILSSYIGKLIVDNLSLADEGLYKHIILLVICFVGCELAQAVLNVVKQFCFTVHNDILNHLVTLDMLDISKKADLEFFDSAKYYDAFESMRRDTVALTSVSWFIMDFLCGVVTFLMAFLIVFQYNPLFSILITCCAIPSAYITKKFTEELYQWDLINIGKTRKLEYIVDVMMEKEYAQEVRLFQIGDKLAKKYEIIWKSYFEGKQKLMQKKGFYSVVVCCLPEIFIFVFLCFLTRSILSGANSVGDYALYTGIFASLIGAIDVTVENMGYIVQNMMQIENVKNFNKFENKVKNDGIKHLEDDFDVEFQNVSFCYPDTESFILKNVSFKINKGEHIGLVGLNGAGKSTIIKLLLRFYDCTEGVIKLNGVDIREYELNELRNKFSTFFQQYVVYAFSLKDNIDMEFKEDGDFEKIKEALELSHGEDILVKVQEDFNTYVTKQYAEDGVELSGGQRQKIALARAFYRKNGMIILDEPSAALDPEAEYKVFERMKELCREKSALFVSHRLSNISFADRIVLLEDGEVKAQGSHKELMKTSERYKELYNYQADCFKKLEEKE